MNRKSVLRECYEVGHFWGAFDIKVWSEIFIACFYHNLGFLSHIKFQYTHFGFVIRLQLHFLSSIVKVSVETLKVRSPMTKSYDCFLIAKSPKATLNAASETGRELTSPRQSVTWPSADLLFPGSISSMAPTAPQHGVKRGLAQNQNLDLEPWVDMALTLRSLCTTIIKMSTFFDDFWIHRSLFKVSKEFLASMGNSCWNATNIQGNVLRDLFISISRNSKLEDADINSFHSSYFGTNVFKWFSICRYFNVFEFWFGLAFSSRSGLRAWKRVDVCDFVGIILFANYISLSILFSCQQWFYICNNWNWWYRSFLIGSAISFFSFVIFLFSAVMSNFGVNIFIWKQFSSVFFGTQPATNRTTSIIEQARFLLTGKDAWAHRVTTTTLEPLLCARFVVRRG